MKHLFFVRVLLFAWLALAGPVSAQDNIVFERVPYSNGLPIGSITGIYKDSTGFLWLGTNSGLYRYDGKSFLRFVYESNNPHSLPSSMIASIAGDKYGRLWVATREGMCIFDPVTKKARRVYPAKNTKTYEGLSGVSKVHIDAQNRVWFGSRQGLEQMDLNGKIVHTIPLYRGLDTSRRMDVPSIVSTAGGNLWLGTLHGIFFVNTHDFTFKQYVHPYTNPEEHNMHNYVCKLVPVNDTLIWVGTWSGGLKRFNPKTGKYKSYYFSKIFPIGSLNIVLDLLPDTEPEGREFIWLCTADKGLLKFYTATETFRYYGPSETDMTTLDAMCVARILKDGNIYWITTNNGLNKFDRSRQRFNYVSIPPSEITNIRTEVTCFAEDTLNGKVYMGTFYNGILVWDRQSNTVRKLKTAPDMDLEYVADITYMHGRLYIAARKNYIYDPATQKTTLNTALDVKSITRVLPGKNGFWVFTFASGMHYYNVQTGKLMTPVFKTEQENRIARRVGSCYRDKKGNIWLGTMREGLALFDEKNMRLRAWKYKQGRLLLDISGITEDDRGNIWFTSNVQGLSVFNTQTQAYKNISFSRKMPTDELLGILRDANGMLWVQSSKGLCLYNPRNNQYAVYNQNDGLKSDILYNGFAMLADGLILIGHEKGFNSVSSRSLLRNLTEPKLVISGLRINDRDFAYAGQKTLRLPYTQNHIQIEFSALNYSTPQKNRYAYMLQGADKKWTYPDNGNPVNYAALEPGRYVFKVRASNNDNVWTKKPLELTIVILPPYWQTWWFKLLAAIVFIMLVYLAYRYRLRQLRRMQRVRNKIADDLHDEVGSALSSISMFAGVVKLNPQNSLGVIHRIEETSRETVENMGDIVWSIQTRNDKLKHVVQRMKQYGQQLFAPLNISFSFTVQEGIAGLPLDMEQRKNLYLVYKEALNNTAKYAAATQVDITLAHEARRISLRMADNGKGFDAAAITYGNGLYTMRERARKLNGTLHIESGPGKGTAIVLVFKPT